MMLRRVLPKVKSSLGSTQLRLLQTQSVAHDYNERLAQQIGRKFNEIDNSSANLRNRGQFAQMLPDYEVPETAVIETKLSEKASSPQELQERHPFDAAALQNGSRQEFCAELQENQVLLMNLPENGKDFSSPASVSHFLKDNVHADLVVQNVKLVGRLDGDGLSFAKVTLASKRQANMVSKGLRKYWFGDRLLKVKTKADGKKEQFGNRTIVIRGLPSHLNQKDIINMLAEEQYGAMVGLELPTRTRSNVAENEESSDRQNKEEASFKRAQMKVEENLRVDHEYQQMLIEHLGREDAAMVEMGAQEGASMENVLSTEKLNGLVRVVLRLQAEGAHVLNSKVDLMAINSEVNAPTSGVSQESFEANLNTKKDQLKKILVYLQENPSTMQTADPYLKNKLTSVDPLTQIMNMAEGEMAHAIDEIINMLNTREEIIDKRLNDITKHFGDEERILLEQKNFGKELEDVPHVKAHDKSKLNVEDVLSVNEQIHGVQRIKNQSNHEKVMLLLRKALNPFQKVNFSHEAQDMGWNPETEHMREYDIPDPRVPRTLGVLYGRGAPFLKEHQQGIDDMIEDLKVNSDKPFDELYHREKSLIQNVINAELALKKKIDNMVSPLPKNYTMITDKKGPFERSKQTIRDRVFKQKIAESDAAKQSYDFSVTEGSNSDNLLAMVESGKMSKKNYERALIMKQEMDSENLGYAFVTFSHADEARSCLIDTKGIVNYVGGAELEFDLIANLKHADLDSEYYMNRAKNNAKLVDDIVEVRHAREELRNFEKDIDNQLPSRKKLKEIRNLAKEVIDNNKFTTRDHSSTMNRGPRDEQRLNDKMKDLQQQYPHVDFTQLFETDRAEDARKVLHKKAYASYKAFQFLKSGLKAKVSEQDPLKLSPAKQRLIDNDPYNFPELNQGLSQILSSESVQSRIVDGGDTIKKRGRRFTNYTEAEMIEAYFGKDFARKAPQNIDGDDGIFSTQKSLRELHPVSQFTKGHLLEMDQKKYKELGLEYNYKYAKHGIRHKNDEIQDIYNELGNNHNYQDDPTQMLTPDHFKLHPTDPKKPNFHEATMNAMDKYLEYRDKKLDMPGTVERSQWGRINAKIRNEYEIERQPKSRDWYDDMHSGWRPKVDPKTLRNHLKVKKDMSKVDETKDAKFDIEDLRDEKYENQIQDMREQHPTLSEAKLREMLDSQHDAEQRLGREEISSPYDASRDAWNYHKQKHDDLNERDLINHWNEEVRIKRDGRDSPYPLNATTQRLNNEYAYKHRANAESVRPISERHLNITKDVNHFDTDADAVDHLATQHRISQAGKEYGGAWFRKYEDQINTGVKASGPEFEHKSNQKRLQDFYEDSDLSEREDQDIYSHYRKLQEPVSSENDAEMREFKQNLNPDEHTPQMPRFQSYLDDQSESAHPFDKITNDQVDLEEDHSGQKEMEDELYRRELMGRLVSERLTPRQFELISSEFSHGAASSKDVLGRIKTAEHAAFLDRREQIRLGEEKAESIRRRKVMDGEWTESNSHQKLNELLQDLAAQEVSMADQKNGIANIRETMNTIKMTDNPERMFEKEYYFDEGLGESLQEHTAELKKSMPDMKVEVRRDRDGFAIVKTSYSPELKYPIDLNFDATKIESNEKQTMEVLLQALMPGTGMDDCVSEASLERGIRMLSSHNSEGEENDKEMHDAMNYDFDAWTKLRIQELVTDRLQGRFKNDDAAFVRTFKEITENCGYDYSKEVTETNFNPVLGNLIQNANDTDAFEALFEDRDRLRHELNYQVSRKAKKHLFATKRQDSDFVQARQSETSIYGRQVINNERAADHLSKQIEATSEEATGDSFDRAAYDKFKAELSQRKEAKERLLSQGVPEFKAYLRF